MKLFMAPGSALSLLKLRRTIKRQQKRNVKSFILRVSFCQKIPTGNCTGNFQNERLEFEFEPFIHFQSNNTLISESLYVGSVPF